MKNITRMVALCATFLILSACGATSGAPYPSNYTGGPPPVVWDGTEQQQNKAPCCKDGCKDGICLLGKDGHEGGCCDMPCCKGKGSCCRTGICPIGKKHGAKHHKHSASTAMPATASAHANEHAGDVERIRSAYDEVMQNMHVAMGEADASGHADTDFVIGMIPHHQGAVDMAYILLEKGEDPRLRRLAKEIIVAQRREIAFMKYWLETRGEMPASNISNVNVYN